MVRYFNAVIEVKDSHIKVIEKLLISDSDLQKKSKSEKKQLVADLDVCIAATKESIKRTTEYLNVVPKESVEGLLTLNDGYYLKLVEIKELQDFLNK